MKFTIVRAEIEHLGFLAPLFSAYRQFYGESVSAAAELEYMRTRLDNAESVVFLAISMSDADTALGFVQLYPGFDSVVLSPIWVLHDLYVRPNQRRSGVGRSLMSAAHDFCRSTDATRIDLSTEVTNDTAKSLYRAMGYDLDEEFDHYSLSLE
jgi:ribosomal protein S18 acetylase RimI-like enzyme